MSQDNFQAHELRWGTRFRIIYNSIVVVGMVVAGLLFGPRANEADQLQALWFFAMLVSMMILPELVQLSLLRAFGARPNFRFRFLESKPMLNPWWAVPTYRFTRRQYAAANSVPFLLAVATGIFYIALTPAGRSGILLIAIYSLVRLVSLWLAVLVLQQPRDALFEEREDGVRVFNPVA